MQKKEYAAEVVKILGEEEYRVTDVVKNNGIALTGITKVAPAGVPTPTAYIDKMYEAGLDIKRAAEQVREMMDGAPELAFNNVKDLSSFEKSQKYLTARLLNTDRNKVGSANSPLVKEAVFGDLALVPVVEFPIGEDGGMGSVKVTEAVLSMWGVSAEVVFETAKANLAKAPYRLLTIQDMLTEMLGFCPIPDLPEDEKDEKLPLYVLRNESGQFGAALITRPDILEMLEEKFGEFAILPSSVHEVLILPDQGIPFEPLLEMVREVNGGGVVEPQDVLSDYPYYYRDGVIEKLADVLAA